MHVGIRAKRDPFMATAIRGQVPTLAVLALPTHENRALMYMSQTLYMARHATHFPMWVESLNVEGPPPLPETSVQLRSDGEWPQ